MRERVVGIDADARGRGRLESRFASMSQCADVTTRREPVRTRKLALSNRRSCVDGASEPFACQSEAMRPCRARFGGLSQRGSLSLLTRSVSHRAV